MSKEMELGIISFQAEVESFLSKSKRKFDLIFMDPPYDYANYEQVVTLVFSNQLLTERGILVLEHDSKSEFSQFKELIKTRKYGKVQFSFFEYIWVMQGSKIAVFPGSFDPITIGHEEIVKRALPLFDKIIVAIGLNSAKTYQNPFELRLQALEESFKNIPQVVVDQYEGLTIDYCKSQSARFLLRGLRNPGDFEFEKNIALVNRELNSEVESIFLLSEGKYSGISSTIVREIQKHGGDFKQFIPDGARHLF